MVFTHQMGATMNVRSAFLAFFLAALLVGCANRPETIRASFVSHERFMALTCLQLVNRMAAARADLDKFSRMQDGKATGDAWGVFLIGVPLSKLSGDHEGDVARLKGEVEAIETAQIKVRCMDGGSGPSAAPIAASAVSAPTVPAAAASLYTPQPVDQPARRGATGADALQAEQYAKQQQCSASASASLVAKGAGFETYSLACANGDAMMVRCEFGNCRALR